MTSTTPDPALGLGELARRAGVPVATVKYYLREGLLPEGRLRSPTRADYGPDHLERLRLLRLLREVGDVPVDRLRALVEALDDGATARDGDRLALLSAGVTALTSPAPPPGPHAARALELAEDLRDRGGWTGCGPGTAEHEALRAVLETVLTWEEVGLPVSADDLVPYVEAADRVARHDISSLHDDDPDDLLTQLVVGQVVYGRLLAVLRRVAEAHHSVARWGPG